MLIFKQYYLRKPQFFSIHQRNVTKHDEKRVLRLHLITPLNHTLFQKRQQIGQWEYKEQERWLLRQ